mgnify:CR=1 FL=1
MDRTGQAHNTGSTALAVRAVPKIHAAADSRAEQRSLNYENSTSNLLKSNLVKSFKSLMYSFSKNKKLQINSANIPLYLNLKICESYQCIEIENFDTLNHKKTSNRINNILFKYNKANLIFAKYSP